MERLPRKSLIDRVKERTKEEIRGVHTDIEDAIVNVPTNVINTGRNYYKDRRELKLATKQAYQTQKKHDAYLAAGIREVRVTKGKGKRKVTTKTYQRVAQPKRSSLFVPDADTKAAYKKKLYGV